LQESEAQTATGMMMKNKKLNIKYQKERNLTLSLPPIFNFCFLLFTFDDRRGGTWPE